MKIHLLLKIGQQFVVNGEIQVSPDTVRNNYSTPEGYVKDLRNPSYP